MGCATSSGPILVIRLQANQGRLLVAKKEQVLVLNRKRVAATEASGTRRSSFSNTVSEENKVFAQRLRLSVELAPDAEDASDEDKLSVGLFLRVQAQRSRTGSASSACSQHDGALVASSIRASI